MLVDVAADNDPALIQPITSFELVMSNLRAYLTTSNAPQYEVLTSLRIHSFIQTQYFIPDVKSSRGLAAQHSL